jgi:hypothetical protein
MVDINVSGKHIVSIFRTEDLFSPEDGDCIWYYLDICLEGVRKTTKNPSQGIRSLGRDLNPGPPEYEA